jgi:hypothetical protein
VFPNSNLIDQYSKRARLFVCPSVWVLKIHRLVLCSMRSMRGDYVFYAFYPWQT